MIDRQFYCSFALFSRLTVIFQPHWLRCFSKDSFDNDIGQWDRIPQHKEQKQSVNAKSLKNDCGTRYQYEPNFIRWYFQPLLRYSPIKFACVALKSRYPSVIWCQEKISPEKSPRKGSGVGLGLGLESWGLFSRGLFS